MTQGLGLSDDFATEGSGATAEQDDSAWVWIAARVGLLALGLASMAWFTGVVVPEDHAWSGVIGRATGILGYHLCAFFVGLFLLSFPAAVLLRGRGGRRPLGPPQYAAIAVAPLAGLVLHRIVGAIYQTFYWTWLSSTMPADMRFLGLGVSSAFRYWSPDSWLRLGHYFRVNGLEDALAWFLAGCCAAPAWARLAARLEPELAPGALSQPGFRA